MAQATYISKPSCCSLISDSANPSRTWVGYTAPIRPEFHQPHHASVPTKAEDGSFRGFGGLARQPLSTVRQSRRNGAGLCRCLGPQTIAAGLHPFPNPSINFGLTGGGRPRRYFLIRLHFFMLFLRRAAVMNTDDTFGRVGTSQAPDELLQPESYVLEHQLNELKHPEVALHSCRHCASIVIDARLLNEGRGLDVSWERGEEMKYPGVTSGWGTAAARDGCTFFVSLAQGLFYNRMSTDSDSPIQSVLSCRDSQVKIEILQRNLTRGSDKVVVTERLGRFELYTIPGK